VPVHAGEDLLEGRHVGIVLGDLHDQAADVVVLERPEHVDHVEARFGGLTIGPVDGGDEDRGRVGRIGVVAEQGADRDQVGAVHPYGHLAKSAVATAHRGRKLPLEEIRCSRAAHGGSHGGHRAYPSSEPGSSPAIFFCSFMTASSRPSGRGGQPGM